MPLNQVTTSNGKQYVYTHAHNSFVFYSCRSSTHRPGSDATEGNRSMQFQKNSYAHARSIHGDASLRGESVSTYPCRPLAEESSDAVDVVEESFELHRSSVE